MRLSICCPKFAACLWGALALVVLWCSIPSCRQSTPFGYRKTYTPEESRELANNLAASIGSRNIGTPREQMLLAEAQRLDPGNAAVYHHLGDPYLYRGIVSAFPNYYAKAVRLDPLAWTGWRGYLYLYFYRDYTRALADFDATDTITPDVVDYPQSTSVDYMRGICYLRLGRYPAAIDYFDRHIEREIEVVGREYIKPETFLYRGIAYLELTDTTAALQSFAAGRELTPDNADLHFWTAKVHADRGDMALAQRYLTRAESEFTARNYNRRFYGEPFFPLYAEDLATLRARFSGTAFAE